MNLLCWCIRYSINNIVLITNNTGSLGNSWSLDFPSFTSSLLSSGGNLSFTVESFGSSLYHFSSSYALSVKLTGSYWGSI